MDSIQGVMHQLLGEGWTSTTAFATCAATVSFLAGVIYIVSIFRGKTVPHPFTWLSSAFLTGVSLFLFLVGGGEEAGLMMVGDFVVILFIAILSMWRWKKHALEFEFTDKIAFGGSVAGIALYAFSQNALIGFLATVFAEVLGTIPTLRKAYKKPEEENLLAWTLGFSGDAINIFAIQTLMDGLYVWSSYVLNGSVWAVLMGKRKYAFLKEYGIFFVEQMRIVLKRVFLNREEDAFCMYTSVEEAREEILRRWNDESLKKKVLDSLGGDVPEFFLKEPMSVLARHIATPTNEVVHFLDTSILLGVKPVVLEYTEDRFSPENFEKYHLGRTIFSFFSKKKKKLKLRMKKIIDFNAAQKKKIAAVKTVQGEDLLNFHHKFFSYGELDAKIQVFDMSEWCKRREEGFAENYYDDFFSLFLCFGVLCENYLVDEWGEGFFTKRVVLSAFWRVHNRFGIKPLIIRLLPQEKEADVSSMYYPVYLENFFKGLKNC